MAVTDLSARTTTGSFILTSGTERSLPLDPNRIYSIHHTGLQTDLSTADTNIVVLGLGAAPVAYDGTEELNKLILKANTVETIGPGISSIYAKALNSGAPALNIIVTETNFGVQ